MTIVVVDPVGMVEIAERLGTRQQTVAMWKQRNLLPEPSCYVSGNPCWGWVSIRKWAQKTSRL